MTLRCLAASCVVACLLIASPISASELTDQQAMTLLTSDAPRDKAVRRALGWLRAQQCPDGAVGDKMPVALTALALMAHFAAGHAPDDVTHGEWLRLSLRRVLAGQHESGYFGAADNSRMYGHGIVTLMLAEALGMCRDDDLDETIRAALERAVAVTVKAARVAKQPGHEGGWHYQPDQGSSDLSLSGWQLMSLHATQQVGIAVPEEVVLAAVGYAKRLTSPDGQVGYEAPGSDHPALRGLAMLSLAIGGQGDAPEVARIADRIQSDPIAWEGPWFFYRAYYDSVGLSRAAPLQWQAYGQTLESVLVDHQQEDGSWPNPPGDNEGEHGGVYTTSMAVLALSVRKQLLPAYQR